MYRSHGGLVWRAVLTMSAGSRDLADEATSGAFARVRAIGRGCVIRLRGCFARRFGLLGREMKRQRRVVVDAVAVEAVVERSVLPLDLTAALRRLSPDQRVAVFLHYFADLSVAEVAVLSGSPVATVKVRLHRRGGRCVNR